jgi:CAAX prenyl protease-like protein
MAAAPRHSLSYYVPRTLPFLLTAAAIYLGPLTGLSKAVLYPAQTLLTAVALAWYWKDYRHEIRFTLDIPAIAAGIGVFLAWILLEGYYPFLGQSPDAAALAADTRTPLFLVFRLAGAALVIPLAEELFWRSFALRFLENTAFKSIPLGHFTWFSFILVSLAFGLEHHRWLPGIIAGLVYAGLLYRTRNLFSPIVSHAVTNLLLGIYVLTTGRWEFW